MPTDNDGDFLFPTPSLPPSMLSPYHWPGVSAESTRALRDMLNDNHRRWHIFFNDRGFHNHSAHRAIAIWSLGADPAVITAGYKLDCKELKPVIKSPESITDSNFEKHLGDERFYDAYVDFLTVYVRQNGIDKALETFILSKEYNTGGMKMLGRFLAGLLHPLIHTGYGAEFSLPGMIVQGIAQTCVHPPDVFELLPESLFNAFHATADTISAETRELLASTTDKIGQVTGDPDPSLHATEREDVHALTILARVAADPRLTLPEVLDELTIVQNTISDHAPIIRAYVMQWSIDLKQPGEINRKVEEIAWMVAVIYGIAGWTWAQRVKHEIEDVFNADFFLLTAFIPSLLAHIHHSPQSQVLLLRSYLAAALAWYVARARPKLDICGFFTSTTATPYPLPVNPLPTPDQAALPGQDKMQTRIPDPWLPIVQTTTVHPDQHLPKAIRAFASWASNFGTTPPCTFTGPQGSSTGAADAIQDKCKTKPIAVGKSTIKTELPGAEYLDGTLFVRAAGLTVARMGRVGQGEKPAEFWDLTGFFEDPQLAKEAKERMKRVTGELL